MVNKEKWGGDWGVWGEGGGAVGERATYDAHSGEISPLSKQTDTTFPWIVVALEMLLLYILDNSSGEISRNAAAMYHNIACTH